MILILGDVAQCHRPSQDILVSAISVLGAPKKTPCEQLYLQSNVQGGCENGAGTDQSVNGQQQSVDRTAHIQPCLVSGICIRRNSGDLRYLSDQDESDNSDVQAMNQV